ncbi:NAD-binding protein [Streptomyces sp. NPDC056831]|uniref:NAD-binding protein n=1 Tax=Streptomyces sp. NPDC056831 TaxID=3345954 RepID=UPI00367FB2CF
MPGRTAAVAGQVAIEYAAQPVGVAPAYGALRHIVHDEQASSHHRSRHPTTPQVCVPSPVTPPPIFRSVLTPTFTMPLLRKDLDLGLSAARELEVPMPLAAATAQLVAGAIGAGHVEEDFAALILEQARNSGITLTLQNVHVDDGLSPQA